MTAQRTRLLVFRSHQYIYASLVDDEKGKTLVSLKGKIASEVGKSIAKKAQELGITKVQFDRGKYKYHGKVKELATGAREGGLVF